MDLLEPGVRVRDVRKLEIEEGEGRECVTGKGDGGWEMILERLRAGLGGEDECLGEENVCNTPRFCVLDDKDSKTHLGGGTPRR